MQRLTLTSSIALMLQMHAAVCAAQSFSEALGLARSNEPTYLTAKANTLVSQEKSKQALASMLPQVTASANTNANHRDYATRDAAFPPAIDRYNSNGRQITITQPLWRHANLIAMQQANAVVSQAELQLAAADQELVAKLTAAWCDAMFARDNVLYASRQVAATKLQWDTLKRAVDLGTMSAPALAEARAKYDQALSEQVSAEMEMNVRAAVLEQIIGPRPSFKPPFLASRTESQDLTGDSLDQWLEIVEKSNPGVLAAEQAVAAARHEIRRQRAGHQPTLDLVGSYGYSAQTVGNFPGQNGYEIKQGIIGLQLSIPIYAGGGQDAKVGEAAALAEKANQELEGARRTSRLAAKQAWFGWQAGRARQLAALQAVKSSALALVAASLGRDSGLKTDLDVLQARQQVEGARRDLNRARYDMIASAIKLKAAAGTLKDADVLALDQMFSQREADLQDLLADR